MKLKKLLLATLLIATFSSKLSAQEQEPAYNFAVGLRLGYEMGFTARHFFMPHNAIEGIMSFSNSAFKMTVLYQFQQPFPEIDNLDWYVGIGAHIGSLNRPVQRERNLEHGFLFGADLIAGIEYVFPTAPFSFSLDWKPSFSFTNPTPNQFLFFAMSVRYTFGR